MLLPDIIRESVYLDFEGEGRRGDIFPLPHMAGLYRPKPKGKSWNRYEVLFFKSDWIAPRNGYYKISKIVEFREAFKDLTNEVVDRGSKIIYWSNYELQVIERHFPDILDKFKMVSFNLLPAIRKVKNRREWELQGEEQKTLNQYLEKFDLTNHIVEDTNIGPAELCRRIDNYSKKYKRWRGWPESKKKYVQNLLEYNKQDCKAVWRLSKKLANLNQHRREK